MDDCRKRREILHQALTASVLVVTAGCGTVLHPERRGQEAGPLDWNVVALDAVGLLFFFVLFMFSLFAFVCFDVRQ